MRGVTLSYETVREWCLKFGQTYANNLRRRSPRPGDRWHLDEVFLKINGRIHYLWRAVDQDGEVLDILVQSVRPVLQKWLLFGPGIGDLDHHKVFDNWDFMQVWFLPPRFKFKPMVYSG